MHVVRKLYHATLALVGLIAHLSCLHAKTESDWERGIWRIERHWLEADERQFGEFIGRLGESSERNTDLLLHGAGNVFRGRNPSKRIQFYADCADLPYILRAYYAYMHNLPFSWVDSVRSEGGRGDIRYSRNGNRPTGRRVVKDGERLTTILREISGAVSSGTFRMNPGRKGTLYKGELFPDFYSPKLDRRSIRPGTVVYDPNGHVAIIYRIDANGRMFLMDEVGAVGTESLLATGKVPARAEVSSLKDSGEKIKWYLLEQRLRNQIDRSYEANTAFTLRDLSREGPLKGNGVPEPPVIEIREFLESVVRG